jgi:hypothetical protein
MAAEFLPSVKGSLTFRKILQQWADGFISLPKEIVLHIFIAHKNPSSTAGIEPTNLGPMASMITTENDKHLKIFTNKSSFWCYGIH